MQEPSKEHLKESELRRYELLYHRQSHTLRAAENYDVSYYRLRVRFLKSDTGFTGSVYMAARSLAPDLATVDMNAASNLVVDSVTDDAGPLVFNDANEVLTVSLRAPVPSGDSFGFTVHYSSPFAGSAVANRPVQNVELGEGTNSIASQAEPYDARAWWPCKDDPADKADSLELFYTSDSDMVSVGNGVLVSSDANPDGTKTYHWRSLYPIATYLVSLASAKYTVNEFSFTHGGKTMPVGSWFFSMTKPNMAPNETVMLDALGVLSDRFGTYPFIDEKYGMAEYRAFGGAMEHQTVTSMGFYGSDVTVHELAHQWFGDKVTCATFEHIWLNEGWATYCEALYRESSGGHAALTANMAANKFFGPGTIFVNDPENNPGLIFSGDRSYNKASWVLHMLRHVVGDSAFFPAVRKYLGPAERGAYRSVKTEEFQQYLEAESGVDLNPFFQNWIYGQYFPTYKFYWDDIPNGATHTVNVTIEQVLLPATQIFTLPIDLTFTFANGGDTTLVVQNDKALTSYTFQFDREAKLVQLDRDEWILKRVQEPLRNPTFDKGILLVNGVDWDVSAYTADIKAAYADSIFTGKRPYTFWDLFPNPSSGYPPNMAPPSGTGQIPVSVLGQYCTMVWIANGYNGDDFIWQNTSIWEYLKAGGNVVLITRYGRSFITTDLQQFLGVQWTIGSQLTITECVAGQPWLSDMTFTGEQLHIAPFETTLTRPENVLLFTDQQSFAVPVGIGAWGKPELIEGKQTGHMVFLSMRPYRIEGGVLRRNMDALLDRIPCIPVPTNADDPQDPPRSFALSATAPNPVALSGTKIATISFTQPWPTPMSATLTLYDGLGRMVRQAAAGTYTHGTHSIPFSVADLRAGVYTCALTMNGMQAVREMVVVR